MFKFFAQIRQKPKHVRNNYALFFASIFSVFAFSLWLFTHNYSGIDLKGDESKAESEAEAPFSTLLAEVKSQFSEVKNSLNDLDVKEEVETTNEEATTTNQVDMEAAFRFSTNTTPVTKREEVILLATTTASTSSTTKNVETN